MNNLNFSNSSRPHAMPDKMQPPPSLGKRWPGQIRFWLMICFFVGIFVVGQRAAPTFASLGAQGTVPPKPTVLVGPIDEFSLPDLRMVVAGVPIKLTADTRISLRVGDIQEGGWARVTGLGDGEGGLVAARVKTLKQQPFVKMRGPLDELTDSDVVVDSIGLNRTQTTFVVGDPEPGTDRVNVRAAIESTGELLALQVRKIDDHHGHPQDPGDGDDDVDDDNDEVDGDDDESTHETRLVGVVEDLPDTSDLTGIWTVSGIQVQVTSDTEIKTYVGPVVEGSWVKMKGTMNQDDVLVADQIRTVSTRSFHKLQGILGELTADTAVIDGLSINVTSATRLKDNPQPGDLVKAYAFLTEDGTLVALAIHNKEPKDPNNMPVGFQVQFVGKVGALPSGGLTGDWIINGRTIIVPESAVINEHKGRVAVGAMVRVKAILGEFGSLTALEIQVLRGTRDDEPEEHFVEFEAEVKSLPNGAAALAATNDPPPAHLIGTWEVGDYEVKVTPLTRIKMNGQEIKVGTLVKVKGYKMGDELVLAREIEAKKVENPSARFAGLIVSIPEDLIGEWVISAEDMMHGRFLIDVVEPVVVIVTDETELKQHHGEFAVGAKVKVKGEKQSDDKVKASKIETLRGAAPPSATPMPTETPEASNVIEISVVDDEFIPAEVEINPGDTVVWKRINGFHNVQADDGSFGNDLNDSWTTYEHTFDEAGVYRYYCEPHGGPGGFGMAGVVKVREN